MAEYGFFESVNGDRLYYSENFNKYFKGFFQGISSDGKFTGSGVFRNVGDGLTIVKGSNALEIIVQSGKAIVDYHWYDQSNETIPLILENNLNSNYGRYDLIVLRCNSGLTDYSATGKGRTDARSVGLAILRGTPDKSPKPPTPNRNVEEGYDTDGNDNIYELPLASIYLPPKFNGVLNESCIINNAVAPVIQGIISTDADIQASRNSYNSAMNALYTDLQAWITKTQNTYDQWFYDITSNLTVGGYVKSYKKYVKMLDTRSVILTGQNGVEPNDYVYDTDDVFIVNYNGLALTEGTHYTIVSSGGTASLELDTSIGLTKAGMSGYTDCDLSITILKSNLSQKQAGTLSSSTGEWFVYANDVVPGTAYGFKIHNLSADPEPVICYCHKNLLDLSEIESWAYEDKINLVNNGDGSLTISGINDTGSDIVYELSRTTREFAFPGTYVLSCSGSGTGGMIYDSPSVIFSLIDSEDTVVVESSDSQGEVFETTSETFGNTVKIRVTIKAGAGVADEGMNYTIYPQIECGTRVHTFEQYDGSEFTYNDGLPTFNDQYVYMWAKSDNVARNLQLVYYVLSDGSADNIEY